MTSGPRTGATTYTTPQDTEIVASRIFDAPIGRVFAAWTEPRHLQQWLLGPEGWTMPVCEMDLRPGGAWRYVWRKDTGEEMAMSGAVLEVVPPRRVVTTERWGPEWPETTNTLEFTEEGGRTRMTLTIRYPSKTARDAALGTGMKSGMDISFERLDRVLPSIA
jgi:uncharacterized protein YndB with AHSA1/START domain